MVVRGMDGPCKRGSSSLLYTASASSDLIATCRLALAVPVEPPTYRAPAASACAVSVVGVVCTCRRSNHTHPDGN